MQTQELHKFLLENLNYISSVISRKIKSLARLESQKVKVLLKKARKVQISFKNSPVKSQEVNLVSNKGQKSDKKVKTPSRPPSIRS